MPDFKIGAAIALDGDEQFKKQLKEIDRSMSLTRAESKKLSAEFDDVGSSQEALRKKGELLQKQYDDQKKKLDVITEAVKKYETAQKDIKERIDATKSALADAEKNLERTAEQYGKNSEEAQNAAAQVDELTQGLSRQEAQAEKISTSLDSWRSKQIAVETQLVKTKKAISDNETATNKLTAKTQIAAQKMKDFGDSVEKVGEKVDKIGDKTEKLGNSLTTGVTVPLVAIGTAAIASFNEVDDGLDIITQKTGATGEQLKSFETIYKNIGGTINAQFSDIGSAVGEVNTRLELQGDALEQASIDFLKYARVNGTDVNTSIQLVSRAMGDASIESSKYGMVLDNLTKAGQMSGISVDKLAESLAKYGAPLRMLGYEIEDSIALFAAWEKAGVNTEIAFSGMRQAMGRWSSEGKNAQEEFAKLLQQLKDAPDLATAAAIATENFGTEAGNDLADAVRGGRFEVEKYTEALKNSSGTLQNTYAGMTDESDKAAIAMQEAKIALSDIGETILTTGAPLLKDLSEVVKEVGEWFNSLTDEQRENIVKWSAFIAIGGPAVSTLGKITKGMGSLVTTVGSGVKKVGDWLAAAKSAKTATDGLETAASVASGSFGSLGTAIGGTTGLTSTLITGLGSVITTIAGPVGVTAAVYGVLHLMSSEKWKETEFYKASLSLSDSFSEAGKYADEFAEKVKNITIETRIGKIEDSEEVEDAAQALQDKLTEITSEGSQEREKITEDELLATEEAYKKLVDKLSEETEKGYNSTLRFSEQVKMEIENFSGSSEEYMERASFWIKNINSLYEDSAANLKDSQQKELEALQSLLNEGVITLGEYEVRVAEVNAKFDANMTSLSNIHKDTLEQISSFNSSHLEGSKEFFDEFMNIVGQNVEAEQKYYAAMSDSQKERMATNAEYNQYMRSEWSRTSQAMQDTVVKMGELFDDENQMYLNHYAALIRTTVESGGELTDEQKFFLSEILNAYDAMPSELQEAVQNMFSSMNLTFDENKNVMYTNGEGVAQKILDGYQNLDLRTKMYTDAKGTGMAVIDGLLDGLKGKLEPLKKTTGEVIGVIDKVTKKKYEIRSPSRLMRRLGGYITEGFALGLKDNDRMVENASKLVARIPEEEMNKLSRRAQAAGAMTLPMVSPQAARAQSVDMNAFASVMVKALKDAGLTVQMDAKTVGYLTAPAVGKQLGFDAKRGKRN